MSAKSSLDASSNASETAAPTKLNTVPPQPPPTAAARPPTSQLFSRGNLTSSRLGSDRISTARPSTAVRAVGYAASAASSASQRFDRLFTEKTKQKTLASANSTVDSAKEVNCSIYKLSPQVKYKNLEAKIIKLLEASVILSARAKSLGNGGVDAANKNPATETKAIQAEALNKAKEAFSLDRTLHRFRDQHGENIFHNFDLTYAVFFNLAEQYEHNDMHIEALNTYSIMTKNKMFPHVNQLKLNMGNIYYKMGIFPKAIKMYRMALDSVPNNLKQLRLKITHNIGILFVRMGQYADAAASFEFIMSERADILSGIHLILCYYAMGDVEKIKSTFRNLCDVQPIESESDLEVENNILRIQHHATDVSASRGVNEPKDQSTGDFNESNGAEVQVIDRLGSSVVNSDNFGASTSELVSQNSSSEHNRRILKMLKCDELTIYIKQRRNSNKRAITMIVDLISPIIEDNCNEGYNWCIEIIKTSSMSWLANELELNKALVYLRQNDVNQAIETLQMYDRKSEGSMTASALINLSFIYINLGNLDMAAHCVNQLNDIGALQTNAMALVNASIIDFLRQNYPAACTKLERALQIEPDNFEANYNLGLISIRKNDLELAEEQFQHLKSQLMVPHSVQHSHVFYQLAKLQEKLHNNGTGGANFLATPAALQSYLQVLGISAAETDSRLFEKVGTIYEQIQDHQEANQYYNEAYRINPSDISIASSIGSYYIKLQATEKAIYYYERAVLANPNDPNLMLRVASCFRNSYLPAKQYLCMFEKIYSRFPDDLTCVRALMQVTKTLGMPESHEKYALEYTRLHKLQLERQNEQQYQQQRLSSAASGRGNSRLRGFRNANEESASRRMSEHEDTSSVITSSFNGEHYIRASEPGLTVVTHHPDPLGPPAERPRTGMVTNILDHDSDDEEINTDSLLPI